MRFAIVSLAAVIALGACSRQAAKEGMSPVVPSVSAVSEDKQILFGDLHVHSTYSIDAFIMNLPVMSGEGARPLSEACDYARYCSGLDFWSTTEHAESVTPKTWGKIKQQMRECSAESAADGTPQTIVFTGFEWTQLGLAAATQYGHKNVIFKSLDDDQLPPRPIAMGAFPVQKGPGKLDPAAGLYLLALLDIAHPVPYTDLSAYMQDLQRLKTCPAGVDTRKLPKDCQEVAPDSTTLFEKLNQGGYEALVIPHGTAWGLHVPHLTDWKSQLTAAKHDALRQRLFEVYSGHGSSEQVKTWNEPVVSNGKLVCPLPSKTYLPCCYQAGEIVRKHCADPKSAACEADVAAARQKFVDAGLQGFRTVKGAKPEEWLNCGQCTDCFSPAFNYRPNATAQRALASTSTDPKTGRPMRFTWGFIGSSDTHRASPGSGVVESRELADGTYPANSLVNAAYTGGRLTAAIDWEFERQASFWYTGGLAAVHATAKTREAIWDALQRRETYATSGPRILLWFDLLNADGGAKKPMGAEADVSGAPTFEVRAVGAFRQKPGCPPDALGGGADVRERICRGACYNPSDERIPITRLEIVKVRPQVREDEPMDGLVQDPWRVIPCADQGQGCKATFTDDDFARDGRYALYYVRAIQEATPGVNSGGLRCEYDTAGRCVKVNPCYGDYRTAKDDQCYAPTEERAWSSPIYVTPQ